MPVNDDSAFWSIFAYLISGLVFWGGVGALADYFFGTHYLLIIGLILGIISSMSLIWLRFLKK
jgi:ATP synthase protein I